jgi:outer membrane protein
LAVEEQDLMFRVAQAHFDFLAAQDDLDLARQERITLRRQLAEAEERFQAGLGNVTAVREAQARFSLAQAAEIEAEVVLQSARQVIAEITGSMPADLARLSETFPMVPPENTDVEVWVEQALFQNPRLDALQAQADALRYDMRRERNAAFRPTLDLVGNLVRSDQGGSEFGGGRQMVTSYYGLRLSVPIYNGGRGGAVVRSRKIQINQAGQRIELERRAIERETRQAFHALMAEVARVDALKESVFSQEVVLSSKEETLRAGLGTQRDVLDATQLLFEARRNLARSRYRYILSGLKLKQATGILSSEDLRQINAYMQ